MARQRTKIRRNAAALRVVLAVASLVVAGQALFADGAFAQAPMRAAASNAEESVVRRGAPDIVLPSSQVAEREAAIKARPTQFSDATLRGAIGQVPSGAGECVIEEGRFITTVSYANGLPQRIVKSDSGVREERSEFRWNDERVLLERLSWTLRVLQPATRRGADRWEAQVWSVETTTWDDYGRPLERQFTQASGQIDRYTCEWLGFRAGHCSFGGPLDAQVKLTSRGEVEGVTWVTRGDKKVRGTLDATWRGDLLENANITRAMDVESEHYRYDEENRLTRFRRVTQIPRGERVVSWLLHRNEQGNVDRVTRRCEGPCEGMRGTVTFQIRYDEGLTNTFCGAWWDDGIEPSLKGW